MDLDFICIFQKVMAHVSVMIIEGMITALRVLFLRRNKSGFLEVVYELQKEKT